MLSSTATVHRRQKHHWRTKRLISNTWPHNEASHSRFPFPVAFFLPGLAGSAGLAGFTGIFGLFNLLRLVWDALTDLEVVGGLGVSGLATFAGLPGDSATVLLATHISSNCFCNIDCCCSCSFCSSSTVSTIFSAEDWFKAEASSGLIALAGCAWSGASALPTKQSIIDCAALLALALLSLSRDLRRMVPAPSTAFQAAEATPEQTPSQAEETTPLHNWLNEEWELWLGWLRHSWCSQRCLSPLPWFQRCWFCHVAGTKIFLKQEPGLSTRPICRKVS